MTRMNDRDERQPESGAAPSSTGEVTRTPARRWRRALPRWAQLLVLTGVFVAGGLVGAILSVRAIHARIVHYREHPEELPEEVVSALSRRLDLDAKQESRVLAIFRRRHTRIVELQGQVAGDIHAEFDALESEIAALLDARHAARWRETAAIVRRVYLPPLRRGEEARSR